MFRSCLLALAWTIAAPAFSQQPSPAATLNELLPTAAVNAVGTWTWEQRGGKSTLELKSEAGTWTGVLQSSFGGGGGNGGRRTGGRGNTPSEIKNVVIEGDTIRFEVERKRGEFVTTTTYAGVIAGDEIAGVVVSNFGGQTRESAWMAARLAEPATPSPAISAPGTTAASPSAALPSAASPSTATPSTTPGTVTPATGLPASEAPNVAPADPATASAPASVAAVPTSAEQTSAAVPPLTIPAPMGIPAAGEATDGPYQPRAILPGGIVLTLYPPNSPYLKLDRVKEVEKYSLSDSVPGRINSIVNIHNPSIEVHLASPANNTGSVVILAAGGGHRTLNVGTESADFVPYFFNYGVNTVILRNRLRSDGYEPTTDAVRDALQAIRLVRKHAETWKFDPNRIGIMGFSAGAELSMRTAIEFEQFDRDHQQPEDPLAGVTSRPDFVGSVYPGPSPFSNNPETPIPRNTPPSFIVCPGTGDRIHAKWATDYFAAMLDASIPNIEMHIYANGRHPGDRGMTGGLTYRQGIPFGKWQDRFIEWFDDLGFLTPPGTETKAALDVKEFVNQPPRERRSEGR